MQRADKYSKHSSMVKWFSACLQTLVFAYKLSSSGFESRCYNLESLSYTPVSYTSRICRVHVILI